MATSKFYAILENLREEHEQELQALRRQHERDLQILKDQLRRKEPTVVCLDSIPSGLLPPSEFSSGQLEASADRSSMTSLVPQCASETRSARSVASDEVPQTPKAAFFSSTSKKDTQVKYTSSKGRASCETSISQTTHQNFPSHVVSMLSRLQLNSLPRLQWHDSWELYFAVVIIGNAAYIGFRVQNLASTGETHWGESVVSLCFCVFFTFELFLRAYATRLLFFSGRDRWWNVFDTVVIACMVTEEVLRRIIGEGDVTEKLTVLTVLRLLRIMRILRATRLIMHASGFPHARLLLMTIQKSVRVTFWLVLSFLGIIYMLSLIVADAAVDRCVRETWQLSFCHRFGSLGRAVSTVYQAFVGGLAWGELFDPLNDLGWGYTILFVLFISFFLLVLMQIYTGMLVIEVQRVVKLLKNEDFHIEHKLRRERFVNVMETVFKKLDLNENGALSFQEFEAAFEDELVSSQLATLEIDIGKVEELFALLDQDGSKQVTLNEFILGCLRLQGKAKAIDLEKVKQSVDRIDAAVSEMWLRKQKTASPTASQPALLDKPAPNPAFARSSDLAKPEPSFEGKFTIATSAGQTIFSERVPTRTKLQGRSIQKAELRAMLVSELEDVIAVIVGNCYKDMWIDMTSGNSLTPQKVNLYHFNYYVMSPETSAEVVILKGLEEDYYGQDQTLRCVDKDGHLIGEVTVLEETQGTNVKVKLEKGQIGTWNGAKFVDEEGSSFGTPSRIIHENSVSYKELISSKETKPDWFCCHWWGEPIFDFVKCCQEHSRLRKKYSYWVCAYAHRQHDLAGDLEDPDNSSFRRAMNIAEGVLLVLDSKAMPFQRIWCGFELYNTVSDPLKMLDIITQKRKPRLLTEDALPSEGHFEWRQRENKFPMPLLAKGLRVQLEDGSSTVPLDKENILNSMGRDKRTGLVDEDLMNKNVLTANNHLRSRMAVAVWPQALKEGKITNFDADGTVVNLLQILRSDDRRTSFHLNLCGLEEVVDADVANVGGALPPRLTYLNLSFDNCTNVTDGGLVNLAICIHALPLRVLCLDFGACSHITDLGVKELAERLPPTLEELTLVFAFCPHITKKGVQFLAEKLRASVVKLKATFKGTKFNEAFDSPKELKKKFRGMSGSMATQALA